jgi:hypothetical protein
LKQREQTYWRKVFETGSDGRICCRPLIIVYKEILAMKTPILIKSSLIGTIILVVLMGIAMAFMYPFAQEMVTLFSNPDFLDPGTASPSGLPPQMARLLSFYPIFALLGCLAQLGPAFVAGWLYARWHNQEVPIVLGAVKGGAASGALAQVIGSLIAGILGMIVMIPLQQQMMTAIMSATNAPPPPVPFGGTMILAASFGLICSAFVSALFGAALGALGGLIGDSLSKGKPYDYAGGDVIG